MVIYAKKLAQEENSGIDIELFLAGGVVRTLLSQMYKFVHERNDIPPQFTKPITEVLAATALTSKLSQRGSQALQHLTPDFSDPIVQTAAQVKRDALLSTEFHLKQATLAEKQGILSPFVLGVGSDLDVFYEVKPLEGGGQEALTAEQIEAGKRIATKLEQYINRVAEQSGLTDNQNAVRNTILPHADVTEFNAQRDQALGQGGSLLDVLGFKVINEKRTE